MCYTLYINQSCTSRKHCYICYCYWLMSYTHAHTHTQMYAWRSLTWDFHPICLPATLLNPIQSISNGAIQSNFKETHHITDWCSYLKELCYQWRWLGGYFFGQLLRKSENEWERSEVCCYLYWIVLCNNDISPPPQLYLRYESSVKKLNLRNVLNVNVTASLIMSGASANVSEACWG